MIYVNDIYNLGKEASEMDKTALGKRIKEARMAKKMTQAEVVGSFITRNMLSQIESGTATPSVNTLEYLSRVLEVPMTYLMPAEADGECTDCAALLTYAKQLFFSGEYEQIIELKDSTGTLEDEFNAIKAKAYLELAEKFTGDESAEKMQAAVNYAKFAAELSQKGIYSNEAVKTEAMLVLNNLAQRLAEYYKSLISE